MRTPFAVLALAMLAAAAPARAQAPSASPCDRLAGEEQKRCVQIEQQRRREQERLGREEDAPQPKCDALFGPEKELCLKRGGTVRAGSAPSGAAGGAPSGASGGSAPSAPH